MEKLAVCRICLDGNVHVHVIENPQLQEIYERLTTIPFQTNDMRPLMLCYICHGQLRASRRLMLKCLKAEELLTEMLNQILTKNVDPKSTMINRSALNQLSFTETQRVSIDNVRQNVDINVKKEMPIVYEMDVKMEGQSLQDITETADTIDLEYDNGQSVTEGVDMPVKIIKHDIETEAEPNNTDTVRRKEGNGLKQAAPIVKKLNLKPVLKNPTKDMKSVNTETYNVKAETSKTICNVITNPVINDKTNIKIKSNNVCDVCGKSFTEKCNLKIHVRLHTGEKPYICNVCDKGFSVKHYLRKHARIHTGEKPYSCDVCNKHFAHHDGLKAHTRLHTNERPFACNVCPKSFHRKDHLILHTRVHTGERPYVCDVCNKSFREQSAFVIHQRTHAGGGNTNGDTKCENMHCCNVCGKRFNTRCVLIQHSRTHTGEKPYVCDVCNKCFSQKGNLNKHARTHTGDRPYVCDVCGKGFGEKAGLHAHAQTHTGDRPYVCDVCGKSFRAKNALMAHARLHTGERPFACNICSKRFNRKDHLMAHTRIHTGEKPYVCNFCEKGFIQRTDLIKHIRIHTGEKASYIHKRAAATHSRTHTAVQTR